MDQTLNFGIIEEYQSQSRSDEAQIKWDVPGLNATEHETVQKLRDFTQLIKFRYLAHTCMR